MQCTRVPGRPRSCANVRSTSRSFSKVVSMSAITGKSVVITGANQGLGLEFVKQFIAKGNKVVAAVRKSSPELDQLATSSGVSITQLDLSSPDSIQTWAECLRQSAGITHVDYIINNAGVLINTDISNVTVEAMETSFKVNSLGPLLVTQALLGQQLIGPPGSVVVSVTSKMGSVDDNRGGGSYAYRASKAALNMINKSLSIDLAPNNITCVLLHPGWVKTRMTNWSGLIDVQTSVSGMIGVLESSKPLNGKWYDFASKEIPW